ncbi:MAG: hypothetical protein KKC19_00235 [Nanoarchaeota archaeon]|nr:hypothetical protein [Nanoarchaeota archaeon]
MAKEDIVEGLRYALAKGETLDKAMMSFFNSGYTKEEIEDAARILQAPQVFPTVQQSTNPIPQSLPQSSAQAPLQQAPSSNQGYQQLIPGSTMPPSPTQKISAYGTPPHSSGKAITIVLVLLLLILLGILVSVFLFKTEISNFLSGF